jgi:hypothetical protein
MLAKDPDCPGSLGLAISGAVEDAVSRDGTHYAFGSVPNHVMLHQTVNGLETKNLLIIESGASIPETLFFKAKIHGKLYLIIDLILLLRLTIL